MTMSVFTDGLIATNKLVQIFKASKLSDLPVSKAPKIGTAQQCGKDDVPKTQNKSHTKQLLSDQTNVDLPAK